MLTVSLVTVMGGLGSSPFVRAVDLETVFTSSDASDLIAVRECRDDLVHEDERQEFLPTAVRVPREDVVEVDMV